VRVTILGCGASGGVPRIGNDWGACEPTDPRNRRLRASVLVEHAGTTLLVDTSPDLRTQCLLHDISAFDAVLYTHDHADHTHGIDDLRAVYHRRRSPVPVYGSDETLATLRTRFGYVFAPIDDLYPVIAAPHPIGRPFRVGAIEVVPFAQDHGGVASLGFRFGALAYSTDLVRLDEAAFDALAGVKVWIVDALRYEPHPTHAHVELALAWIERVRPERAILTHMTAGVDYGALAARLPERVRPGHDGLVLEC